MSENELQTVVMLVSRIKTVRKSVKFTGPLQLIENELIGVFYTVRKLSESSFICRKQHLILILVRKFMAC